MSKFSSTITLHKIAEYRTEVKDTDYDNSELLRYLINAGYLPESFNTTIWTGNGVVMFDYSLDEGWYSNEYVNERWNHHYSKMSSGPVLRAIDSNNSLTPDKGEWDFRYWLNACIDSMKKDEKYDFLFEEFDAMISRRNRTEEEMEGAVKKGAVLNSAEVDD